MDQTLIDTGLTLAGYGKYIVYVTLVTSGCAFLETWLWPTCPPTSRWYGAWKFLSALGNLGKKTSTPAAALDDLAKAAQVALKAGHAPETVQAAVTAVAAATQSHPNGK